MAGPRRKDRKTVRDLFPSEVSVQRLYCTTKEEAITELLNALTIAGVIDLSREKAHRDAIVEREQVASTGIGNGVAIPHTKSKYADKFGVAVGLSEDGIDFSAHDGQLAQIVFLWICPTTETKSHLALMRAISSIARDPDQAAKVANVRDRKGLFAVLEQIPVETKGG